MSKLLKSKKTTVAIESIGNQWKGPLSHLTWCVESECVQNNLTPAAASSQTAGMTEGERDAGHRHADMTKARWNPLTRGGEDQKVCPARYW